ncbi:uncharacterized protein LOC113464332, partial [Ceratina calcarata]|uniref:Uncharacterized protein LOC113464332 n=1 Tax=Ceratina calcarata TaxID=156304 RepID=A0AAJ7S0V6_9HYME
MASGFAIQMDRLGKENYDTWKQQIEAVLVKNDRWEYVDGTKPRPEQAVPATDANTAEIAAWDKNDHKAKADITLAINPSELCHVKNCTTSREMWIKLESIYQSKGPAKKTSLLKRLLFTKMKEDDDMASHVTNFLNTVDKLYEMDITISEDLLAILLLYSVPDSYDNFRCAIEARDELPDTEALKVKLLEEFNARKGKGIRDDSEALFVSKQ